MVLATCWKSFDLDMAAVPAEVSGEAWDDEASGNLLQTFWDLSSLEEQKRLQAAKKLVSGLRESQVRIKGSHILRLLQSYSP